MRRLSTTSYALLGMMASRDWTAYALIRQMERSLGYMWPRAASGIYLEPRALLAHGLVQATDVLDSKRIRARYSITDRGREALADWVAKPSARSVFESEGALKLIFADISTKTDALRIVHDIAEDARARNAQLLDILADYTAGRGTYPDRPHVVGLTARLYHEHYAAMIRWEEWARAEIDRWPATDHAAAHLGQSIISDNRRTFGEERLAQKASPAKPITG